MTSPMQSFTEFIRMLLQQYSGLSRKSALDLVNEKTIHIFRKAFTHKSANMEYNYELLETIGDSVLNAIVKQFLVSTKKGTTPEIVTRIYHNLTNKKSFGDMAKKLGFLPYIECDPEELRNFETRTLEDVFEAFAGAVMTVVNIQKGINGLGYVVVSAFMINILNKMRIETDIRMITPFVSQLQELGSNQVFRNIYGSSSGIEIVDSNTQTGKLATVYVSNRVPKPGGGITTERIESLSTYEDVNAKLAREGAAKRALDLLREKHSIEWRKGE